MQYSVLPSSSSIESFHIPLSLENSVMMKIERPTSAAASPKSMLLLTKNSPASVIKSIFVGVRKRPRRTVQFSEARVVGIVANRTEIPQEQSRQIWYPSAELEHFKTEARSLCRQLREQHKAASGSMNHHQTVVPRGLEQRVCCLRQKHRYLAIRCVLKAQERCRHPDFVGAVAQKCNQWAKEVAQLEAQHDYVDVYRPQLKALLPTVKDIPMYELPIQSRKRKSQEETAVIADCSNSSSNDDSDNDSVQAAQRNVRARRS